MHDTMYEYGTITAGKNEVHMNDIAYPGIGGAVFAIIGIWSVVGLGIYVWYLWSLARLFPYLGLPSAHGWIPVWNQWRLIERGGLPGWLVLLGLVPGLAIVVLIVSIIAIHRINQEHGEGAGMTVLGALIAPLWATLLGSRLRDRGYNPQRQATATAYGAAPATGWQPPAAQPKGVVEYGPDGQVYPLLGAQTFAAPTAQAAAPGTEAATPAAGAGWALPPVPPVVSQAHSAPAAPSSSPVVPGSPAAPAPAHNNPWSLGATVDNNFERLAQEALTPRDNGFGSHNESRPFAWPEPQAQVPSAPPVNPVAPAPVAPAAPVVPAAPVAPADAAPVAPAVPVTPAAVPAQVVATPVAPPAFVPAVMPEPVQPVYTVPAPVAPPQAPVGEWEAVEPVVGEPAASAPMPVSERSPEPVAAPQAGQEDAVDATVITGGASAPIDLDDDSDRTIVVSRTTPWVLELPDGRVLELPGDDVVIGRRPVAIDEAAALTVPDATRTLSKSHARLRRTGDTWTIEDLNSTNGVFVFHGDAQIEAMPGVQIAATEHLVIGTLEVRLRTA